MKKVFFGITIAIAAISASAFTTINNKIDDQLVGKLDTDEWMIIYPEEQGLTWDCFSGGTVCKGILKLGATPDMRGLYSDNEVYPIPEVKHFELIAK